MIFGSFFGGAFGARFLAETQGKQMFVTLPGAPKGLHFGIFLGPLWVTFWVTHDVTPRHWCHHPKNDWLT